MLICNIFPFHVQQQSVDTLRYGIIVRKKVGVTLSLTLHLSVQEAAVTAVLVRFWSSYGKKEFIAPVKEQMVCEYWHTAHSGPS